MIDEDKKAIFGLSFPAIMVLVIVGLVISSTKK
jgi:hypothetical protein